MFRLNSFLCGPQEVEADHWQRVFDFTNAFLPAGSYQVPPLTPAMWIAAVRRFKPRAARGPDGYARQDLLQMPLERVCQLLELLTKVEHGS